MIKNVAMLMVIQNYVQFQDIRDIKHKFVVHIIWMAHVHTVSDAHLFMIHQTMTSVVLVVIVVIVVVAIMTQI